MSPSTHAIRTLTLVDGRALQVHLGNWHLAADAPVLVCHHGTPGWGHPGRKVLDLCAQRGLRVLGPTRAGYATSDPAPGRDVAAVAADVAAVLDRLEVPGRVLVTGASGGGPHALATAALLRDRVAAVSTVAGVGPYGGDGLDFLAGMGEENVTEFGAALQGEAVLRPYLEGVRPGVLGVTPEQIVESLSTLLPPVDREAVTGELADDLVTSFSNALEPGVEGWLEDDLAFTRPWGFDLAALDGMPVTVWQGGVDLMVPPAHGAWLAGALPGARSYLLPDDGHLSLQVGKAGEILDDLLAHL